MSQEGEKQHSTKAIKIDAAQDGAVEPSVTKMPDDSAVSVSIGAMPKTLDLERLNVAIANLNDATTVADKISQLVRSLNGLQEQIASPQATPRQAAILQSEAVAVCQELTRVGTHDALSNYGRISPVALPSGSQGAIQVVARESAALTQNLDRKRLELSKELAHLETAHLNAESSHTAVRQLDLALSVCHKTRMNLLEAPQHAIEACGALGARARALLLSE